MPEHTPGPWKVDASPTDDGTLFVQHGIDEMVGCVAEVLNQDKGNAAILANASLIAAAPELLAALQRAVGIRSPNGRDEYDHPVKWTAAETARSWEQWEKQAREAIAKATGQ